MYNKLIAMSFQPTSQNMEEFEYVTLTGNLDKYRLRISEESKDKMIISDFGFLVSKDPNIQAKFIKECSLLGFFEEDRDGLESTFMKSDNKIAGNWLKWVSYQGWQIRAVREENDKYLLFVTSSTFDKTNWTKLQYTTSAFKWVSKSEVEEI